MSITKHEVAHHTAVVADGFCQAAMGAAEEEEA